MALRERRNMSSKRYPEEFRIAAVRQIKEGGTQYQMWPVDSTSPRIACIAGSRNMALIQQPTKPKRQSKQN